MHGRVEGLWEIKRIAVLTPYYPVANEQVIKFTDSGFEVVRDIYLQCKSWTAIAEVPPDVLREKLIELNGNGRDVDADRPGRNKSEHFAIGGRGRDVAWQACHRHQHGDLLARAPSKQDLGQDSGARHKLLEQF